MIRDFRVRFRRTFLSIIWLLLPLITLTGAAVFLSLKFSTLTEFSIGQYLINLLIGLMLWQLMADAWLEPMRFARRIRLILISYPLDKNVILLAGNLSALFNFLIKIPIVILAMILFDQTFTINFLMIPVIVLFIICLGTSLSCFMTPLSLGLLDIRYSAPIIQYALLLATPIFYVQFEAGFISLLNASNPFTYVIPLYRDIILGVDFNFYDFIVITLPIILFLLISLKYYKSKIGLAVAYIGR